MSEDILAKRTRIAALFDIYSDLLTEKQQEAVSLFYEEDCSLSEIAESFSSTRQAVNDLLKRTLAVMERYESSLGLLAQQQKRAAAANELEKLLMQSGLSQEMRNRALLLVEDIRR